VGWFKSRTSQTPQQLMPSVIKFVGEQDGPAERDLKVRFTDLFHGERTILRAYLARTDYGDATGVHVALCVKSSVGEDTSLISKVVDIFRSMFGSHEHLDVVFVRDDQEPELLRVCVPFYRAK